MKKISVLVLLLISIFSSSLQVNASSTDIIGPDVIHKQSNHILTISNITALYSSTLGQIQVLEDNYTGYGNIVGTHTITLSATSGTTTKTKTVDVVVIQELGNVTAVTDFKDIYVKNTQILTPSEIVYVLEKTGYIEITATTQMMILTNTYTDSSDTEGQYLFEFRLINSAGIDEVYSSLINVSNDQNLFVPDITFEAPPSILSNAWNVITSLFYLAVFVGIGIAVYKVLHKPRKKV